MTLNLTEIDGNLAERFGIRNHPGYAGAFTRQQAVGAIPNKSKVRKVLCDPSGDLHPVGAIGTVLGSISVDMLGIMYWIEWDANPRVATVCHAKKIEAVR